MSNYKPLIPALTSNNDQGFVVTTSSVLDSNLQGFRTFDQITAAGNGWHSAAGSNQYIKIEFPKVNSATKLILTSKWDDNINYIYPNNWHIAYSLDDINYTDICTIYTERIPNKQYPFTFNTITFKYIKIYKIDGGNYGHLGEFQIYGGLGGFPKNGK